MASATGSVFCKYCTPDCRPLAWGSHGTHAYVDKIYVDRPRLDVDICRDGRHIKTHISINYCPKCGAKLRKDE